MGPVGPSDDDERAQSATVEPMPTGWLITGVIDTASSATLGAALTELPKTPNRQVDVDLAGVTFMDSSGIRLLLELAERAETAGSRVVVRNASSPVRQVLEITKLETKFGLNTPAV